MKCEVEALFTPAEFQRLAERDLSGACCVVFDVLRATSTIVTALANGAKGIIPVSEIREALDLRRINSGLLLAGERNGLRIGPELTGGIQFDLGNSPREYTPDKVRGRTIVSTTTNGTRALRACTGAELLLAGSFLNLTASVEAVRCTQPKHIILVGAGTGESAALEDVTAVGAFADLLLSTTAETELSDATEVARACYKQACRNWPEAMFSATNARRLLSSPELREDVDFCLRKDVYPLVAVMADGAISARP